MANIIPYQPVEFNLSRDACLGGAVKPVKVAPGDVTQFQLKIFQCGDEDNFIDFFGGAIITGNFSQSGTDYCDVAGAASTLRWDLTLQTNRSYFIQYTVSGMTAGSLEVQINLFPDTLITVTEDGVYSFYFSPPVAGTYQLTFSSNADFDGCINDPSIVAVDNNYRVFITDQQQNVIAEFDKNSNIFTFQREFLTVDIDWESYVSSPGCYLLTVSDPCINTCSQNRMIGQNLFDQDDWILSDGPGRTWTVANQTASFTATGLGIAELISHQSLCSGITYEITYTLSNMANNTFQLNVGGTLGVLRSTNGTFTETITAGGSAAFRMIGDSPSIASDFEVTGLSFEAVADDVVADFVSNEFDYDTHSCTHLINAINNEDAFGMGFYDTTFNPRVRVSARIFPHTTDQERLIHEDSKGRKHVIWGNNNWIELLRVVNEAPHVLKFLSLLPLFNHWYIGTQEYFVNDDEFPEISWNKFRNCGSVDLEIRKKEELIKQQDCTDQTISGILGEDQFVEEEATDQPVFTTIGEKIPVRTQP